MPGTSLTPDDAGALFALMPNAVCVLDAGGRILHANPAWQRTLQVRPPQRSALGVPAAIAEIRQCPEKYDAAAVEACCRLYERGELDL